MTDRDALLSAIVANPDEDTPRLVFADWLDEHGTADDRLRARFIRVQVEMTRLEERHPRWRKLYSEERRLRKDLTLRGVLPTAHLQGRVAGRVDFERGFLASITVYAKRFLAEAEAFFAADPIQTVRFARLSARHGSVPPAELFRSPHLARLRALDLSHGGLNADALGHMADGPHLAGLRSVTLTENPLTAEGVSRLADSPNLPALATLDFNRNGVRGEMIATALAARPGFRRIRALNLFMTEVTLAGVRAVAESPYAAGLEYFNAGEPNRRGLLAEGEAVARAVAESPHLKNLVELDLSWRRIGLEGLHSLGHSPHLKRLRRLGLRYCNLPHAAFKLAAEAPNFRGLYLLELGARRENTYSRNPHDPDEDALRDALPEAAIRVE
jgi:uncharacterized protein (TIGR02996 family)